MPLTCWCPSRLDGNELWAIAINGSAFLWHQVRCMVAVLLMIGQGVETPSVSMLNLQFLHNFLSNVIMNFPCLCSFLLFLIIEGQ